jgi:hypothetical protein
MAASTVGQAERIFNRGRQSSASVGGFVEVRHLEHAFLTCEMCANVPAGSPVSGAGSRDMDNRTHRHTYMDQEPMAGGPKVKGAAVDEVVTRLREVERSAGWGKVNAIAEILIQGAFGGNLDACRQPYRRANSLRRIANHPACPYRKTRLAEAVAVYVACDEAPFVRTCRHLGPSHVAAVLPLGQDERVELLRRAEADRLSVRQLRSVVVARRRARGERRGRPAADPGANATAAVEGVLSALRKVHDCLEQSTTLAEDEAAELAARLEAIAHLLDDTRQLAHERALGASPASDVAPILDRRSASVRMGAARAALA